MTVHDDIQDTTTRSRAAPLSLRSNFSWTLTGNVVYAASQWGMLVILAKLGTPEMVGQWALGLAITAPIIILFSLSLRTVQATDAKQSYLFADYLGLRLATTLLALLVISAVTALNGYGLETKATIMLIGIAKSFESISDIHYGLLQQHEKMDRIAKSMMIKGPLSLGALAAGVYLTGSVVGAASGVAVAWLLVLLFYDVRSAAHLLKADPQPRRTALPSLSSRLHRKSEVMKHLTLLALPLAVATMLLSLTTNIPRYLIEHWLGERELGFFAATAYVIVVGITVVNALGQSASPRLAKHFAARDYRRFRALVLKLVAIGAGLGMAGVAAAALAGREVLTLLYQAEYAQYTDVLVWLMVAAAASYVASFLGYAVTAARYFKIQVPIAVASALLMFGLCLVLIPAHGILGAAWASTGVFCFQAFMLLVCFSFALRLRASSQAVNALSEIGVPK